LIGAETRQKLDSLSKGEDMIGLKSFLLSIPGVFAVSVLLTLIVLAESIFPPWAPYFIVYAILAIAIPVCLKTYRFGSVRQVFGDHWRLFLTILVLAVVVDEGVFTWLYQHVLDVFGVGGNAFFSLNAAIDVLANAAAHKFSITKDAALGLYALFIVVWAPVGEELFYRGYIQGALRQTKSYKISAIVSAIFFSVRHATHVFFLWPNVPWVAALSWVVGTFFFGLFMSYLYEKTKSLYPPIIVHAAVNVVELLFSS
jgi:membrane protease YdiL (CAAX protease family)